MAYVSLYRKYRPQTFAEVVGQDHVTRTLVNAIEEDRLHHAYLFTGPRGTGKTSTARILAKSVNCEQGPTPTPCNDCPQCRAITEGSSVDVIELDMASHGGVDDARELRDRALFAPATARRKVYILDEVHMASTAAFNALLKLIEEPPGHVIFAMATTDPQKVLPTIMSRVQRLDLRRVPAPAVSAYVRDLVGREGGSIDEAAVDAVVRSGDGSVRDTLSVLEQVLSYSHGHATGEDAATVLGHTPFERTAAAVDAAAAADLAGSLALVQELLDTGADLRRFAFDLLQHLRDLLVLQVAPDHPDLVDATVERRSRLQEQAGEVPRQLLVDAIDLLADAVVEMRQGPPRLPLELAFAKLTVGRAPAPAADPRPAAAPATPVPATPEPADEPAAPAEEPPDPVDEPADEAPAEEPPAAPPAPAQDAPADDAVADASAADDEAAASDDDVSAADGDDEADDAGWGSGLADDLRERANRRAEATAASGGPPDPPQERPPGPEVEVSPPPPSADAEDLAKIQQHWAGILEQVRARSPRFHAMFEPASPVKLRNGVLTLAYGERYRSFHAQNAKKQEYAEALIEAVASATGLRIRVDTVVDGDAPRPPAPPPVQGGAAPPAAPAPPTGSPPDAAAEEAEVREAEAFTDDTPDAEAVERAADLLVAELGAVELDEDDDGLG